LKWKKKLRYYIPTGKVKQKKYWQHAINGAQGRDVLAWRAW